LQLGDESAIPELLAVLQRDEPWSDARVALAWTAYRLGHEPALDLVRRELGSAWWYRRLNAVADLAELGDAGAAPLLEPALYDSTWLTRLKALRALRSWDIRPQARHLLSLVSDEERLVRREALDALRSLHRPTDIDPKEMAGALAQLIADKDVTIRRRRPWRFGRAWGRFFRRRSPSPPRTTRTPWSAPWPCRRSWPPPTPTSPLSCAAPKRIEAGWCASSPQRRSPRPAAKARWCACAARFSSSPPRDPERAQILGALPPMALLAELRERAWPWADR